MVSTQWLGRLAVLGLTTALSGPVFAQAAQTPTREEVQRQGLAPEPAPRADRLAVDDDGIERAPCPLAQPSFADIHFVLNDVIFQNQTVIAAEDLRPAYQSYLGQDIPVAAICDIRDRAATILRRRGYLAAVQVPPQQIAEDGIVRFDVLMAHIARLQVRGETGHSERVFERYLEPLTEQPAFNQLDAERYLLLARELPGYDARLALRPAGGEPGEVIGDVRVERTPVEFEANIQNYGSPATGRFGGQLRAQINDLTGLGDRTSIGVFSSADFDEQLVLALAHDFAIGGNGLRFGGDFTYAWNDPTIGGISPFHTETLIAGTHASYPFILDQGTRLYGTVGFELIDQQVEFGGVRINEDRLRIAYARFDAAITDRRSIDGGGGFSATEPRWRFGLSAELRQGLDIFDASSPGLPPRIAVPQSRAGGKPDATVFRLEGLAELRPIPRLAFVLQPRLQLAGTPLLAYEEFSGGNYTVGRGYDPGAIIGDRGFGFRYEVRAGSLIPNGPDRFAFQPYGFFDAGWVWNEDQVGLGNRGSDSLYSIGAGGRASYGNRAHLDVALAVPLVRTNFATSVPDLRLLVSLTVRFAP